MLKLKYSLSCTFKVFNLKLPLTRSTNFKSFCDIIKLEQKKIFSLWYSEHKSQIDYIQEFIHNSERSDFICSDTFLAFDFKRLFLKNYDSFGLTEVFKIAEILNKWGRFSIILLKKLCDNIFIINEKEEITANDVDIILKILKLATKELCVSKEFRDTLDKLRTTFQKNFGKYSNIFTQKQELFIELFYNYFEIVIKSLIRRNLEFELGRSSPFFEIFSKFLHENIEKINLMDLATFICLMDYCFYRNDSLNAKIINEFLSNHQFISYHLKIQFVLKIFPAFSESQAILKHTNAIEFIQILIQLMRFEKVLDIGIVLKKLKILVHCHSILINDLKLPSSNSSIILLENSIKIYLDAIDKSLPSQFDISYKNKLANLCRNLIYLKSVSITPKLSQELILKLLREQFVRGNLFRSIVSHFHRDVIRILIILDINYVVEDLTDYISKDLVIKDTNIAIELDGLSHYYFDRQIKYSTLFKRYTLTNLGWKVISISYFEWSNLSEKEKQQVVAQKINEISKDN